MNRRSSVEPRHLRSLELAALAIDFDLTPGESDELAAHLATCPACARRVAGLRADARSLALPLDVVPSVRVDRAVYAAIARRPVRPQRAWLLAAAAALLVLALLGALAMGAYLLRPRDTLPDTVVPSPTVPLALASPRPDGSPAASLEPVLVGESWQGVDLPASDVGDGWIGLMEAVTATDSAFVAVGRPVCVNGDPDPTGCHASVWTASAGQHWTRVPDQPGLEMSFGAAPSGPETGLFDVASGPAGLVAIGYDAQGPGVWHSLDGQTWERVNVAFGSPSVGASSIRIAAVAGGPRGYVIVGHVITDGPSARAVAWMSPDGVIWTRADDTAAMDVGPCVVTLEEPDCGGMAAVAATGSGFVAAGRARSGKGGNEGRPAAWTSGDGLTWKAADVGGAGTTGSLSGVSVGGPGLVAVGELDGHGLAATSEDGTRWSVSSVDSPALEDVASTGAEVFALGVLNRDVDPKTELQLWQSDDGVTWRQLRGLPSVAGAYGGYAMDLAAAPGRAVVIGRAGVIEPSGADVFRIFSYASPPDLTRTEALPSPVASPSATPASGSPWRPMSAAIPLGKMEAVTYGGPGLVAVSRDGSVYTATTGGPWVRDPGSDTIVLGSSSTSGPEVGLYDVTDGPYGLVAIGYAGDGAAHIGIWHSRGIGPWQRADIGSLVDLDRARFSAITSFFGGYVIVGAVLENDRPRAAAWVSSDGLTWSRSEDGPLMDVGVYAGTGPDRDHGGMLDVAVGGPGLVAVGDALRKGGLRSAYAWTSVDGKTWLRRIHASMFDGALEAVTPGGRGMTAVGWRCHPGCQASASAGYAGTSDDGRAWMIGGVGLDGSPALTGVAVSNGTVFALSWQGPSGLQLWQSTDDAFSWSLVHDLPEIPGISTYRHADIVGGPDGIVIVGWGEGAEGVAGFAISRP